MNQDKLLKIINEEMTKPEIISLINDKIDSKMSSRDFEKVVGKITSTVMSELFKVLWQKNNFWKNTIVKK